ncbi:transglycosylase domain-containing protein [Plantibacter sp. VKM Ac-2876]|uniref:transglycosylase domain-containing protein n=1 Tax=Plantibacter sp. VKM Ac-2876 TaxID=2783826 RepID=UPI00188C8D2B|nr:transglycosylase domain-containing protein [Plantibacter sp. VKM Ac-2876]MBF4566558.1 transglycosylase domain-containing protein [Plantibacter sp. VKM Ac-2876]
MPQQHRTATGVLGGFLGFLGLSVAAGVLVTATVTPALAVTGIATNSTINVFDGLPDYLALDELAQKSNIYATDSAGTPQLLASFYTQNRIEVGWDQINQFVKDAAVSAEDPRFYEHGGVDLTGTIRAAAISLSGNDLQGGSSITQQYVKNVLVQKAEAITDKEKMEAAYDEATKTTPERKLKEMRMAIGLEKRYGKQDILRGYLNIAGFGGRTYGIEAAANYYFATNAANLNLEQAATLMAIVNNPETLRLDRPESETNGAANGYALTKDRRDYVLKQMIKEGKITQEQFDVAIATVITPTITPASTGCQTAVNISPGSGFFCDYVTRVFQNNPIFGETEDERWAAFNRGGYSVFTTLDLDLQWAAQTALDAYIPHASDQLDIGAVAVTVQPKTGRILAMAQNKDYTNDPEIAATGANFSGVNYNTDYDYGGSSGFQPGSTYKTFTLAEWLKEGHGLNEGVDGRKRSPWGTFKDSCADGGTVYAGSDWNPGNDEGGNGGYYTALQSTKASINTGFIAMSKQLDLCGIRKTAESMGVHRADGGPLLQSPATVLGTNEVAPLSMATAFATFASGGVTCDPIAIDRVVKPDGTEIPVPAANCRQGLEPNVAATANVALQATFNGGTTSASRIGDGIPLIGKTGTTDNNEATWMSGASTSAATIVGVFNATGHVNLRRTYFDAGQVAVLRHSIWPRIMEVANGKYGGTAFGDPDPSLINGQSVQVPDVAGKSIEEAQQILEDAGFGFENGGAADSALPVGQAASTNPAGTVPKGSIITVYTSNGLVGVIPDVSAAASFDDAKAAIQGAGFSNVGQKCVADPAATATKVTGVDPPAGSQAKKDAKITVTITKNKC